MARIGALVLALSGLMFAVAVVLSAMHSVELGPVYSVAQVSSGLAHHPGVWVGRTVRVRGIAGVCLASDHPQSCSHGPLYLMDAAIRSDAVLPLASGRQDVMRAVLRRLPLVRAVVASPQTPRWWLLATYRVQLRATSLCSVLPCYETVLLDAVP